MLFTGVMLTSSGPKVLEYNVRFGDPETQTMMMLVTNNDLALILLACTEGRLHEVQISLSSVYACNVVITASGYPESYRQGDIIALHKCPSGKWSRWPRTLLLQI
jgi:phosphoribosylamine-glycine ligase